MATRKKKAPKVEPPKRIPGEKRRVNFKVDGDIADWAFDYAKRHNTTVTQMITDYFLALQRQEAELRSRDAEQI